MKRTGVICGGSGSSKFALAFTKYKESLNAISEYDLGFIANVSDNFWHLGIYVCPDIDIITYALAGRLDETKGWGIASDSLSTVRTHSIYDSKSGWFDIGDKDLALSLRRTNLLNQGWKLSSITEASGRALGVKYRIIPSTDSDVQTFVGSCLGFVHLQEFWVKNHGSLPVSTVIYRGIDSAKPNPEAETYLKNGTVIICPANPVTSILPSVRIQGVTEWLNSSRVVAISPFVGTSPFSGPAGVMMRALGIPSTSYGVARLYSEFLKLLIVDSNESKETIMKVKDESIECVSMPTRIASNEDQLRLARGIFEIL